MPLANASTDLGAVPNLVGRAWTPSFVEERVSPSVRFWPKMAISVPAATYDASDPPLIEVMATTIEFPEAAVAASTIKLPFGPGTLARIRTSLSTGTAVAVTFGSPLPELIALAIPVETVPSVSPVTTVYVYVATVPRASVMVTVTTSPALGVADRLIRPPANTSMLAALRGAISVGDEAVVNTRTRRLKASLTKRFVPSQASPSGVRIESADAIRAAFTVSLVLSVVLSEMKSACPRTTLAAMPGVAAWIDGIGS